MRQLTFKDKQVLSKLKKFHWFISIDLKDTDSCETEDLFTDWIQDVGAREHLVISFHILNVLDKPSEYMYIVVSGINSRSKKTLNQVNIGQWRPQLYCNALISRIYNGFIERVSSNPRFINNNVTAHNNEVERVNKYVQQFTCCIY